MSPNRLAVGVLALIAAVILGGAVTGDAQQGRFNDQPLGVGTANVGALNGLSKTDNVFRFQYPGTQTFAPTITGWLSPPDAEPTSPANHRAVWVFCQNNPGFTCSLRVNNGGTVYSMGDIEVDQQ